MMEVDSWRGEGGLKGGEVGRGVGGGAEVWISPTDRISPAPNTFGDSLRNYKNQQYFSPEFEQRRENPERKKEPENLEEPEIDLGKEEGQVTYITVGDTGDKPGRISGETFNRFGQNNIKSRQTSTKCCSAAALMRAEQGPCEPSEDFVSK